MKNIKTYVFTVNRHTVLARVADIGSVLDGFSDLVVQGSMSMSHKNVGSNIPLTTNTNVLWCWVGWGGGAISYMTQKRLVLGTYHITN